MLYALQKFRHYLLGSHFNMYTYHSTLRYLVNKPMLGGISCRWLLLFEHYDFEVMIINPGKLNSRPNHLSCILSGEYAMNLDDNLLNVHLFGVQMMDDYFVDIVRFLST
jgi:hypothetical protein